METQALFKIITAISYEKFKHENFFYKNDENKRFFKSTLVRSDEYVIEKEYEHQSGFKGKQLCYEYTATFLEQDGIERTYQTKTMPISIGQDYYYILDANDKIDHIFSSLQKEKLIPFITVPPNTIRKTLKSSILNFFIRNSFTFSEMALSPLRLFIILLPIYLFYTHINQIHSTGVRATYIGIFSFITPVIYYLLQIKLYDKKYSKLEDDYINKIYDKFY